MPGLHDFRVKIYKINMNELIRITAENIGSEHICCAFSDKKSETGVLAKKRAMASRFASGLEFWRLDARAKVFIQFSPVDKAFAPVIGSNYNFIECFWVSGSYKNNGYGAKLLEICENSSIGKPGICAIVGKKKTPFLNDKAYLVKHGFAVCDSAAPHFELLVKKFDSSVPDPKFTDLARLGKIPGDKGFTIYYSEMCPFTDYYVRLFIDMARARGFQANPVLIDTHEKAQAAPSPFTIFSLFHDGEFITSEILSEGKISKLLDGLDKKHTKMV